MGSVRPLSLHYNTLYEVESGGGRVLIDTGPDYRGAWDTLQQSLDRPPDIVIATHGHIDHASLGARWQAMGVTVAVGADDFGLVETPALHRPGELAAMESYIERSGAPVEIAAEMVAGLRRRYDWASRAAADGYPPGGSSDRWPTPLRFDTFTPLAEAEAADLPRNLQVIRCPGHTPGNLVVVDMEKGRLFSGDQLLPEITPTPAIQAGPGPGTDWRFRSLPAFYASLLRLRDLDFSRCYPGHGKPFSDVRARIDANLRAIDHRTAKLRAVLSESGPQTAWSLSEAIYRRAAGRRPWQILSTIQGHLDLLATQGDGRETPEGWTA
jgi:glyoxylase-like metal-dependent hydrolase (beta-lactamase superfamily II)